MLLPYCITLTTTCSSYIFILPFVSEQRLQYVIMKNCYNGFLILWSIFVTPYYAVEFYNHESGDKLTEQFVSLELPVKYPHWSDRNNDQLSVSDIYFLLLPPSKEKYCYWQWLPFESLLVWVEHRFFLLYIKHST